MSIPNYTKCKQTRVLKASEFYQDSSSPRISSKEEILSKTFLALLDVIQSQ